VCYGIIGTLGIAILCRDLGVGPSVLPWVLYAIFATPMIVMVSHRELVGAPPSTRGILYAMIAVLTFYLAKQDLAGDFYCRPRVCRCLHGDTALVTDRAMEAWYHPSIA
jgi:hypothetical protein